MSVKNFSKRIVLFISGAAGYYAPEKESVTPTLLDPFVRSDIQDHWRQVWYIPAFPGSGVPWQS